MTRDDITRMAREAGIVVTGEAVWRLCELVAAFERSECVDIVIDNSDMDGICCADDVLEAIRARGEK